MSISDCSDGALLCRGSGRGRLPSSWTRIGAVPLELVKSGPTDRGLGIVPEDHATSRAATSPACVTSAMKKAKAQCSVLLSIESSSPKLREPRREELPPLARISRRNGQVVQTLQHLRGQGRFGRSA